MDFSKVVSSAYSWISLKKVIWFIVFFWVSLPCIFILPQAFQKGLIFSNITRPVAMVLYDLLYVTLVLGIIVLMNHCLVEKKSSKGFDFGARKVLDVIFLVFVEMFYVLVWNINSFFRKAQLLLLIAFILLLYYFSMVQTELLSYLLWLLGTAYFILVVYNGVRLFFSTSVFIQKSATLGIVDSVKESWALTHNKFNESLYSIVVSVFLAFILFAFVTIALGGLGSVILQFFVINPVAMSLAFSVSPAFGLGVALIAYHYMVAEAFTQLHSHAEASSQIKHILANRAMKGSHKAVVVRRPLAKKAKAKKKSRK
jgi:hypothetical protein